MRDISKGSLLVISIWMLVIFSIFAVGLYKILLSQIRISQRLEHFILSQYAARSICLYAGLELGRDETNYDTLYELNTQREGDLDLLHYTYTFMDEESKININSMPQEVLERLPGVNEDIAEAIAKSSLKPFYLKEVILLLDEIDQDTFSQFSQFITIYGNGAVNINTASREVLAALGLEDSLVDIVISFRAGPDREEGTEDDGVFETKEGISDTLGFGPQEPQEVMDWLDVKGGSFSLYIDTEVLGKKAMKYDIIMNNEQIFQWRER